MGLFDKLKQGLARTARQLADRFDDIVRRADAPDARERSVDVDTTEALEEVLLMADVGVAATGNIVSAVGRRARRGESLRDLVKQEILRVLDVPASPVMTTARPHVILVVDVNGTGKTTTVGKLANQLKREG